MAWIQLTLELIFHKKRFDYYIFLLTHYSYALIFVALHRMQGFARWTLRVLFLFLLKDQIGYLPCLFRRGLNYPKKNAVKCL